VSSQDTCCQSQPILQALGSPVGGVSNGNNGTTNGSTKDGIDSKHASSEAIFIAGCVLAAIGALLAISVSVFWVKRHLKNKTETSSGQEQHQPGSAFEDDFRMSNCRSVTDKGDFSNVSQSKQSENKPAFGNSAGLSIVTRLSQGISSPVATSPIIPQNPIAISPKSPVSPQLPIHHTGVYPTATSLCSKWVVVKRYTPRLPDEIEVQPDDRVTLSTFYTYVLHTLVVYCRVANQYAFSITL
jgi:hypothetical protein